MCNAQIKQLYLDANGVSFDKIFDLLPFKRILLKTIYIHDTLV